MNGGERQAPVGFTALQACCTKYHNHSNMRAQTMFPASRLENTTTEFAHRSDFHGETGHSAIRRR
jgi:hypothetical protein